MITRTKCVGILYHHKGYTFIHLLIGLSISLMIISSFSILFSYLLKTSYYTKDLNPNEWHVFLIQLTKDFKNAKQIEVNSNVLSYQDLNNRKIMISQYGEIIRYQVEGQGHIVMLQHVKEANFQKVKDGVFMKIKSLRDITYEATLRDHKGLIDSEK